MTEINVSSALLGTIGFVFTALLTCIVYFLDRLIKQFDILSVQFGTLNDTMKKIDKDLSGDVGLLKLENATMKEKIDELDPLWDRMRQAEKDIIGIQVGGCNTHVQCSIRNQQ